MRRRGGGGDVDAEVGEQRVDVVDVAQLPLPRELARLAVWPREEEVPGVVGARASRL